MDQEKGIAEDQDGLLDSFQLSPHEDIQAALQAMGVIEDLDPIIMESNQAEMVRQIKLMALKNHLSSPLGNIRSQSICLRK